MALVEDGDGVMELTWTNETRRLGNLIPWEQNPRQIRTADAERLGKSLELFGQIHAIPIDPDDEIIDGHQRKAVWSALDEYGPDFIVDVRVASRKLTDMERKQLSVYLHEGAVGEWDFDGLANWEGVDVSDLFEWGFTPFTLGLPAEDIDYDEMWQGMPEFEQEDQRPFHSVKVHFQCENDIKAFADLVKQNVTDKTKWIWFPAKSRANLKEFVYQSES